MKALLVILTSISLLTSFSISLAQNDNASVDGTPGIHETGEDADLISPDFDEMFKLTEDRRNFKRLREYRSEKENLLSAQNAKLKAFGDFEKLLETDLENVKSGIRTMKDRIQRLPDTSLVIAESFFGFPNISTYFDDIGYSLKGKSVV